MKPVGKGLTHQVATRLGSPVCYDQYLRRLIIIYMNNELILIQRNKGTPIFKPCLRRDLMGKRFSGFAILIAILYTAAMAPITVNAQQNNVSEQNIDPQTAVSAIKMATGAIPVLYITGAEIWGIYSQQNWTLSHPAPGTKFPIYDVKDLRKIASVGNPGDLLLNHVLGGSLTQTTIYSTPDGLWSLYVWHAIVYSNRTLVIAEFHALPFNYTILPEIYPVPSDATYA